MQQIVTRNGLQSPPCPNQLYTTLSTRTTTPIIDTVLLTTRFVQNHARAYTSREATYPSEHIHDLVLYLYHLSEKFI